MKPASVVEYLCNLAEYIETHPSPSKCHVASHLSILSDLIEGNPGLRTAGFIDSLKSIFKSPALDNTRLEEIEKYWKHKEDLEKELSEINSVANSIKTRGKLVKVYADHVYYSIIARAVLNVKQDKPWHLKRAKEMAPKLLDVLPEGDEAKIRNGMIRFSSALTILDYALSEDYKNLKQPVLDELIKEIRNLPSSLSLEISEVTENIKETIQTSEPAESVYESEQIDVSQLSQDGELTPTDEDSIPDSDDSNPPTEEAKSTQKPEPASTVSEYPLRSDIMKHLHPLIQGIIDRGLQNVSAPGIFRNMIDGLPEKLPFEYLKHLSDIQDDYNAGIMALYNNRIINDNKKDALKILIKDQLPLDIFERYVKGLEVTIPMRNVALLNNSRFSEIYEILKKSGIDNSGAFFRKYFKDHHNNPLLTIEQDGPSSFVITRMKNDINIPKKWQEATNADELDQIAHDQDLNDKLRKGEIDMISVTHRIRSYVTGKNLLGEVNDPNVTSVTRNQVYTRTLDSAIKICKKLLTGGGRAPAKPGGSTPPAAAPAAATKKQPQQPGSQNPPQGNAPSALKPTVPSKAPSPPSSSPKSSKSPTTNPVTESKKSGGIEKEEKWLINNVTKATLSNDTNDWRDVFKNLIKARLSNLIHPNIRSAMYKDQLPQIINTFKYLFNGVLNSLAPDPSGNVTIRYDDDPFNPGPLVNISEDVSNVLRIIFSKLKDMDSYEDIVSEIYNVLNMKL